MPTIGFATEVPRVTHVIYGNTVKLANGKLVRYIGINTPETKHPRKGVEYFGPEASGFRILYGLYFLD